MTTKTHKYNPLPAKLELIILDELYTMQVVRLWNNYCTDQILEEDIIHPFYADIIDTVLKHWAPSDILFGLQRSDERDAWFKVSESTSEILCFPEWEVSDHIDLNALIDWLVEDDRYQEYTEFASVSKVEI